MAFHSAAKLLGLITTAAVLPGCIQQEPPVIVAQTKYPVGQHTVTETIYERGVGVPAYIYERVYSINNQAIGRYRNQSVQGILPENPPRQIGDWLVIMSSNHVFFWQPDKDEAIAFDPHRAKGWFDYAKNWGDRGLDTTYSYRATDVDITTQTWVITYRCELTVDNCNFLGISSPPAPVEIQFYSDDQGQTFHLVPE